MSTGTCPDCRNELDAGTKCSKCGFDLDGPASRAPASVVSSEPTEDQLWLGRLRTTFRVLAILSIIGAGIEVLVVMNAFVDAFRDASISTGILVLQLMATLVGGAVSFLVLRGLAAWVSVTMGIEAAIARAMAP
jgi:hypothetical protein